MPSHDQVKLARRFRGQATSCADLGSPLYAELLERGAADIERSGPIWRAIEPISALPGGAVPALRFLGSTHRLALTGRANALAAHYPSCGGDGDVDGAWAALVELSEQVGATDEFGRLLARGVQTNEVGRSAALLGGFLEVARSTELPLRLLEVGSSAGLNLRWDQFNYGGLWGRGDSPVDHGSPWLGDHRPLLEPTAVDVVARAGCDVAPIDPTSADGRLTLLSFIWPDQDRRFRMLAGACDVATTVPATVHEASADEWLARQLAQARTGVATIVFHSVFVQYMDAVARQRLLDTIAAAGDAADASAPLAWLRLEPEGPLGPSHMEVRLTTWPARKERQLATAHPHGTWVKWNG